MYNKADWEKATKENLRKLENLKFYAEQDSADFRLSDFERRELLKIYDKDDELRRKITNYCQIKHKEKNSPYSECLFAATECGVSKSYMRKIIKGEKAVTRKFLGRFCVGLKLTPEESDELFSYTGHRLVFGYTYFDSITMCAIRDGDDIEDYEKELEKYYDPTIG